MQQEFSPHTWTQTLLLHLLPGVANFGFTVLTLSFLWNPSLPPVFVYGVLTNVLVLIPLQLGWLFYLAKKRGNLGWSLSGIVVYQQRTPLLKLLYLVPAVLLATFLIFKSFDPITEGLRGVAPYEFAVGYEGDVSKCIIIGILAMNALLTAFLVPITEELYFRGYLLPRMPRSLGDSAPVVHSLLFATYHFDTPWMIPVRTVGLLPLIYATRYSNGLRTGVISHCLVNLFTVIETASGRLRE